MSLHDDTGARACGAARRSRWHFPGVQVTSALAVGMDRRCEALPQSWLRSFLLRICSQSVRTGAVKSDEASEFKTAAPEISKNFWLVCGRRASNHRLSSNI